MLSSKASPAKLSPRSIGVYSAASPHLPFLKNLSRTQAFLGKRQSLIHSTSRLYKMPLPRPKVSTKETGRVLAYASVTYPGHNRLTNEDRIVAMSPVIVKRNGRCEALGKCSMFALVDGSNGSVCAEFIKDYLFKLVTEETAFETEPSSALRQAFQKADRLFLERVQTRMSKLSSADRSGASVVVLLITENSCYVATLGRCHAYMSGGKGLRSYTLSSDHTLNDDSEKKRVLKAGGQIKRVHYETLKHLEPKVPLQPFQITPGDIEVTRSFGFLHAKSEVFGASPRVVLSQPDVRFFNLTNEHDFIILGSSGTFRTVSSQEIFEKLRKSGFTSKGEAQAQLSASLTEVLQLAIEREAEESVSLLVVAFKRPSLSPIGARPTTLRMK